MRAHYTLHLIGTVHVHHSQKMQLALLRLVSLKETYLVKNYISLLHEVRFKLTSYCCVQLPFVIRQPRGI